MSGATVRPLLTVLVLLPGGMAVPLIAEEKADRVAHSFKVMLDSRVEMELQGKAQKMIAETELRYTWERAGAERTLLLNGLRVKVKVDGEDVMNTAMQRARLVNTRGGKTEEVPFEKAPDKLKTMLEDGFDTPLCKLRVDASGKEIQRTVVAKPGAKDFIDQGMIANASLFHAPFPADKDEWSNDAEVSMGQGRYAKGTLHYKKVPGGERGQTVQVSGTLRNNGAKDPGAPLAMKGVYGVRGEQTYDAGVRDWVAGKLTMDVSMEARNDGALVLAGKGTIVATLTTLPRKD